MTWRRLGNSAEHQNRLVARLKRKRGYAPPVVGGRGKKKRPIGKMADPAAIRNAPAPIDLKNFALFPGFTTEPVSSLEPLEDLPSENA